MKNKFETIIENCARCHKTHKVKFIELTEPIQFETSKIIENYTHWGLCPQLNEPILLKIMKVK